MNKVQRLFSAIGLVIFLVVIHYMIINPLLKNESNLTRVNGIVSSQEPYHRGGRNSFYAILISIQHSYMRFGMKESKRQAFDYLSHHTVVGKHISILYDKDGGQELSDLTYNVYSVTIDGSEIMTISQSKFFYRCLVPWLILVDIAVVFVFFKLKKRL